MGKTAGLVLGLLLVGGLGLYVYSRRTAGASIFGRPPLYSGYGPGALNPAGPPVGKASLTSTLQNIAGVINGGDSVINASSNAWSDVKGLFGNEPDDTYSTDFVNSLPGSS